jgi:hypothetical protein
MGSAWAAVFPINPYTDPLRHNAVKSFTDCVVYEIELWKGSLME